MIPALWKTTSLVPIPKTAHLKKPNHYRLVALTSHLMKTVEATGTAVGVMFFDFARAFNTIWLALLGEKLKGAEVDEELASWILDFHLQATKLCV